MNNIQTLNAVIETLKDGQYGFQSAETEVESPNLKTLFGELSNQRANFAGQLQKLAQSFGELEPEHAGSTAGTLHRAWMDIKSALATKNAHAILAECERGEDSALATYEKAMAEPDLNPQIRGVLQTQFAEVKAAHDRIRSLRDSVGEPD